MKKQMTYQNKSEQPRIFSQTGVGSKTNIGDSSQALGYKHKNIRPNFQVQLMNNSYNIKDNNQEQTQFIKRGESHSQPTCQLNLQNNRKMSYDS